jgi:hypothetical protein
MGRRRFGRSWISAWRNLYVVGQMKTGCPGTIYFGDLSETEYFFIKLCGFLRVLSRDGDMFDLCHGAVADRFVQ